MNGCVPILEGFTLDVLVELGRCAGKIHQKHFDPLGVAATLKGDLTPVTIADQEVQKLVLKEMGRLFPTLNLIGEEGKREVPGSAWTLHFDELDGTGPYSRGMGMCTFMADLCYEGVPTKALVYDGLSQPALAYTAETGKGAHLNGKRIQVNSTVTTLPGQYVLVEVSPRTQPSQLLRLSEMVHRAGANAVEFKSLGYGLARVATGHFAGAIWPGKKRHDACPCLILQEAGAVVTDINGQPIDFRARVNGLIVGNTQAVHAQLLAIVQECLTASA